MKKNDFSLGGNDNKPEIEINKTTKRKFWQNTNFTLIMYLLFIFFSFQVWQDYQEAKREEIPYSEFLQYIDKKEVAEAVVTDKLIRGSLTIKDERTSQPRKFITVPLLNMDLATLLEKQGVKYTVRQSSDWLSNFLFNWVLPFGLLFLLWGWMAKRMGSMGKGFLNLGNKVHIHPDSLPKVTFDEVAGAEEAKQELKEIIDFLKDPSRIQRLGGRMPKGMLLVGAPGTGKTLMARAVAGESGVPFFNISGSEFIEMFVGVGAARVREMFEQAREKAPCIIFIDELDAIGRARGAGPVMGGHDEREQTLNQLLTEMDGFDPSTGVVVMAATNRPEILDKALLRAGRFDRQILVDKPDLVAREEILKLHAHKIKLAPDVDLKVVAQRTPGMVGADLENICNEAAIRAVRENHDNVTMKDFEAAIDRVIAGPEKKHRTINPEEKHRVAFHESGHTLVAETVPTGQTGAQSLHHPPRRGGAGLYTAAAGGREVPLHRTGTEGPDRHPAGRPGGRGDRAGGCLERRLQRPGAGHGDRPRHGDPAGHERTARSPHLGQAAPAAVPGRGRTGRTQLQRRDRPPDRRRGQGPGGRGTGPSPGNPHQQAGAAGLPRRSA
jgi:cell division protease FtsH